jgi:hypothetical protein
LIPSVLSAIYSTHGVVPEIDESLGEQYSPIVQARLCGGTIRDLTCCCALKIDQEKRVLRVEN